MKLAEILTKAYWHFFKFMPCEMILKRQWAEYDRIEEKYALHDFDLSTITQSFNDVNQGKVIWFFGDTGIENAPLIVKKCYNSLVINAVRGGWKVVALTENGVKKYIQLPSFIEELKEKGKMWYALYSDLIRLALLYCYGGIWCDATCYLTKSIPQEILNSPLFFFEFASITHWSPYRYENWFIRAEKKNYVIERILKGLLFYWSQQRSKQDYFVWFHIQNALYLNDEKSKKMMDDMWYCCNYDAMLIQIKYGLDSAYEEKKWNEIMSHCFVQKLTYKYDQSLENTKEMNLLNYILK